MSDKDAGYILTEVLERPPVMNEDMIALESIAKRTLGIEPDFAPRWG